MTDVKDGVSTNRKIPQFLLDELKATSVMRTICDIPRNKLTISKFGSQLKKYPTITMPFGFGICLELIRPTGIWKSPWVYPSQMFVA